MLEKDAALSYAAEHFPTAPEQLVEKFGIEARVCNRAKLHLQWRGSGTPEPLSLS